MDSIDEIKCPKCKAKLHLSWAKSDGIQCKSCYYFIPKAKMDEIISSQERIAFNLQSPTFAASTSGNIICPKCQSVIPHSQLTNEGVMCKKCYSWIPAEKISSLVFYPSFPGYKLDKKDGYKMDKKGLYIIGEKIEGAKKPGRKISIAPEPTKPENNEDPVEP